MWFTARAEYGVRLLVALGQADRGADLLPLKQVAESEGLPFAYLESVAARLRRAGLVEASRGSHGGYRLTREPAAITMEEVLYALEGAVAPMACFVDDPVGAARVHCSHAGHDTAACPTRYLWGRVQGGVVRVLQDTTLADLLAFADRSHAQRAPLEARGLAKELHA